MPSATPSTSEAAASPPAPARPSFARLFASLLYESLAVAAIVLAAAFAFFGASAVLGGAESVPSGPVSKVLLQALVVAALGAYFARCWTRGGQTLAMKAWKLRVVTADGESLAWARAVARFGLAAAIIAPGAAGAAYLWLDPGSRAAWLAAAPALADLLWPLVERDGRFLHDRLAGTRIIVAPPTTSSRAR